METDPTLPDQEEPNRPEMIYDESDEFSLINLVTDRLKEAIKAVPAELHDLPEGELRGRVRPTQIEFQLRTSFWREFEKIFSKGRKRIVTREVFGGICTEGHFYRILADVEKVAWIIRPQEAYDKQLEAIQLRMVDKLWEASEMSLKDPKSGNLSGKRVELFLKVYREVCARKKMMNVAMPNPPRALPPVPTQSTAPKQVIPSSVAAINKQIEELEATVTTPTQPVLAKQETPPPTSDSEVEVF